MAFDLGLEDNQLLVRNDRDKCGQRRKCSVWSESSEWFGVTETWVYKGLRRQAGKVRLEPPESLVSAFDISPIQISKSGYHLWQNHFF